MRDEMRAFLARAADYTLTPLQSMMRLATRAPGLGDAPSMRRIYRLGQGEPARATEARNRVLEVLRPMVALAMTLSELAAEAGVTTSVIKGLVKAGVVLEEDAPRDLPYPPTGPEPMPGRGLAGDQVAAGDALVAAVALGGYRHHAAERRDRIGQDRGVSGGGGRMFARGAAGLGSVAGNCADGGIPDAGRGAVWRAPGRMAFGRDHDRTAPVVEDGRRRAMRRWLWRGAVGAVPAVPRFGADRRR